MEVSKNEILKSIYVRSAFIDAFYSLTINHFFDNHHIFLYPDIFSVSYISIFKSYVYGPLPLPGYSQSA